VKTFSAPVNTEIAAAQKITTLLFDFYLRAAIVTPWGTTNILRLTNYPGGLGFFAPQVAPEPVGTRSSAQAYQEWPIEKGPVQNSTTHTNDQITFRASNVTRDYATMLNLDEWRDVPVVIRMVAPSIVAPAAGDCAIVFMGQIDDVTVTNEVVEFTASNDLAGFDLKLPRENMHRNCRFAWGDDMCGAVRLAPANYLPTKTVGASSSQTVVTSADLTEDTWARGGTPTEEVDALADASITGSDGVIKYTGQAVSFDGIFHTVRLNPLANHTLVVGDQIVFAGGSLPAGVTAGANYYVATVPDIQHWTIAATPAGAQIAFGGGSGTMTSGTGFAYLVKSSKGGAWSITPDTTNWGDLDEGYWAMKDAWAGLANGALKPWITFDFGSAKTMKTWKVKHTSDIDRERLLRLLLFFSSPDNVNWTFERYFEMPPVVDFFEVPIHAASNKRYWRICVRTRWTDTNFETQIECVLGYAVGRNYWTSGFIKFGDATTTVALRGVRRAITASYNGSIDVAGLPVAPVAGDVFSIERGCPRTFNGCSERLNQANFGGFDSLPWETIVR
jgi:hypothetical protein